jgi:hypothetical protein
MYILINKLTKEGFAGLTRKGLADAVGASVYKLRRWGDFYEDDDLFFCKGVYAKSKQGGKR